GFGYLRHIHYKKKRAGLKLDKHLISKLDKHLISFKKVFLNQ
ncbi:uncharacterized protein METZ01_LOCUS246294, partial [marine metagenome]